LLIRRALAALLLTAAGVLAVHPAAAQGGPSGPVVISARDIAAGSILRPPDVRVVQMPDSLRPAGTLSTVESIDGRFLTGAARAGEPITDARLAGASSRLHATGDPRTAVVPVRLADSGVAALLRPGTRVDVVSAGAADGNRRIPAETATVVTVVAGDADARHGPGQSGNGSLVLLELPSEVATQVAAVSLVRPVTVTLR
jgi:Flp pilus assembly protein CpaB